MRYELISPEWMILGTRRWQGRSGDGWGRSSHEAGSTRFHMPSCQQGGLQMMQVYALSSFSPQHYQAFEKHICAFSNCYSRHQGRIWDSINRLLFITEAKEVWCFLWSSKEGGMKHEVTPFLRKMEFDDIGFGGEHGEGWNLSPFSYARFKGKNVCHR